MDKTQEAAAKKAQIRQTNLDTLRTLHNNQVELRHRVDGKKMTFDKDAYEAGELERSGYVPSDWILASEFDGPEGHDHEHTPLHKHPAFEGTGQKIGTHMGETAEERLARGDLSAERTLGAIPGVTKPAGEAQPGGTPEIIKHQQSTIGDDGAREAETKVAAETRAQELKDAAAAAPAAEASAKAAAKK